MGENEKPSGFIYYYSDTEYEYKPLVPIEKVHDIEFSTSIDDPVSLYPSVCIDTPEGSFTSRTSEELYWWIRMGCERIGLAGYIGIKGGSDRRRIKRFKRRIRMFKVKQKIAKSKEGTD